MSVPANTLALNGGAITDLAGNPASLAHAGLKADPAHKVYTSLPSPLETPPDLALAVGGLAASVDLAPLFDGAALAFSALSADPSVATASVEASTLTVAPVREGATVIEVGARNRAGTATVAFAVVVSTSAEERSLLADAFAGVGRSNAVRRGGRLRRAFRAGAREGPSEPLHADGRWHPRRWVWGDGRCGQMAPCPAATGRRPGSGSPLFAGFDQTVGAGGWTAWGAYDRRSFDGRARQRRLRRLRHRRLSGSERAAAIGSPAWRRAARSRMSNTTTAGSTRRRRIAADIYGVYPYFHWDDWAICRSGWLAASAWAT